MLLGEGKQSQLSGMKHQHGLTLPGTFSISETFISDDQ